MRYSSQKTRLTRCVIGLKSSKEFSFGFVRTVTLSGKSLVVCVPSELADQLKMKQGQKVRIIPIAREGFMVKVGK